MVYPSPCKVTMLQLPRFSRLGIPLMLSPCLAGATIAPALGEARNTVSAQATTYLTPGCDSGTVTGAPFQGAGCNSASAGSLAESSASAGLGALHASARSDAGSIGTASFSGNARASAYLYDAIAIAGPANSDALLTGSIVLQGSLLSTVSGSPLAATVAGSSYDFSASFFGQNVTRSGTFTVATNGYNSVSQAAGAVLPVSLSIHFDASGWAVGSFSALLSTSVDSAGRAYQATSVSPIIAGHGVAEAAFGHTAYWGGISSLTINGVEQSGYALLSASGADYRVATIPEPGSWMMLAFGLVALRYRMNRPRLDRKGSGPAPT